MIPVDQIRVGYGRGQCTEASMASLLECRLEDVPDLWNGVEIEVGQDWKLARPTENFTVFLDWLNARERFYFQVYTGKHENTVRAYYAALNILPNKLHTELSNMHHWAAGNNPDGIGHMVVAYRGVVVHDPNPRRRSIIDCDEIGWLLNFSQVRMLEEESGEELLALKGCKWSNFA